jgi:hypothetical protein
MKSEKPQVHGEPMTAAQMMLKTLNDTMKHPPLFRYDTAMVALSWTP